VSEVSTKPGERWNIYFEGQTKRDAAKEVDNRPRSAGRRGSDKMNMRFPTRGSGRLSDQEVWSTICYLDPEQSDQKASRCVLAPVIVFLTFWLIFGVAMYALTVRATHTRVFPVISILKTMD
jgi:hypothetical protein